MEISATSSPFFQSSVAPQQADPARDTASDFETFLKLLTTQLKNQDPLKPLDSTDFVAQLASFSGVEQQVRTNESLAELKDLLGHSSTSGLAAWIGTEIRAERAVHFDGTPVDVFANPPAGADAAELVVTDLDGNEVQRTPVPLGEETYQWAGAGSDGIPLANGAYALSLEAFRNGEVTSRTAVSSYGRVNEARIGADGIQLILEDGTEVSANSVEAIRGSD